VWPLYSLPIERFLTASTDRPDQRNSDESPWRERIRALRNMPPVLKILWDSGPGVVTW